MRSSVVSACLLVSVVASAVDRGEAVVAAQSLGQVAAEEEARRKAIRAPARVLTKDDLRPATSPLIPQTAPDAPAPAASASGATRCWRRRRSIAAAPSPRFP